MNCNWEQLIDEVDDMLLETDYAFASNTLEGIREWVETNQHCTFKQREAVKNIKNSVFD